MPKANGWTNITLRPLLGPLDMRSRPADLAPGAFRYKRNFQVTTEGKLRRRAGFERAFASKLYDLAGMPCDTPGNTCSAGYTYHNHDHHYINGTREPITFLYETTWGDGNRQLFDGTETRLSMLDETNGTWTHLLQGVGTPGSGCYWSAAFLQDVMIFTNNVDNVVAYDKATNAVVPMPFLTGAVSGAPNVFPTGGVELSAAKIAIEYQGVMMLMNVVQSGQRRSSRIVWSDLNLPLDYDQTKTGTKAGQQDLDYGDEILGAALMLGSVYIYTRRKIWRCTVSGDPATVFNFQTVYAEPKNQRGCLAYPRTLVSVGAAHYFLSRDGAYMFSPYVPEPQRDDWLHRATGAIFANTAMKMTGVLCNAPVAEFMPSTRELWFSWASAESSENNWTLVAQLDHQCADVVDTGFTAFVNYRSLPDTGGLCNEPQEFLAASSVDFCIKDLTSEVFYREFAVLVDNDPTNDLTENGNTYETYGFYSELIGEIPTGLNDREKIVRSLELEDDVKEQDPTCKYRLWIGNSFNLVDSNSAGVECAPNWRDLGTQDVMCIDGHTVAQMQAENLKAFDSKFWACYEMNRHLYFRLRIEAADGSEAIGADTALTSLAFDCLAQPKA